MRSLETRLRLYTPLGARQGVASVTSLDGAVFPLGDVSTIVFSVSNAATSPLPDIAEVAFEIRTDTGWVEPQDSRFLVAPTSGDTVAETKPVTHSGQNLVLWLMRKLQIERGDAELVDDARRFNSSTPGAILSTFLTEGHDRGWGPGIAWDFTATADSAGQPWASVLSLGYRPGEVTALQALQNLYDQGVVDFRTEGRTLRVFNAGTGVDRSVGARPVRLQNVTQRPVKVNIDSLLTDVVLYGDDGFTLALHNTPAITALGRLEAAINQGGVSDEGTATLLAQRTLDQGAQVRREVGNVTDVADAEFLPFIDYGVGDWVRGDDGPTRVYQLTVTVDTKTTISTTLNDRYLDLVQRLAKRTTGILGGAVTGGTGGTPGEDLRKPKAPVGLVVSSTGYWAGAIASAQASFQWAPVTQGENSVSIDVDGYEVWAALGDGEMNALTATTTDTASWSPFEPGTVWRFAVRARSRNGVWGELSAETSITMASPTLEVGAPSTPTVSSRTGLIEVQWNGALAAGGTPPSSFLQVNVEISANASTGFTVVDTIFRGGERRQIRWTDGDSVWVRLVCIDVLGRASAPSTAVNVTVAPFIGEGTILASYLAPDVGGQLELQANDSIVLIAGQLASNRTDQDATAAGLADLRQYFSFEPTGMYISMPGSPARLRLANDRIEMIQDGQVVARWVGGQMQVVSILANDARIGNHLVSGSVPGHTTWRPV